MRGIRERKGVRQRGGEGNREGESSPRPRAKIDVSVVGCWAITTFGSNVSPRLPMNETDMSSGIDDRPAICF